MATKKIEYTVVGNHAVFGHEPNTTFSAVIPAEQEKQLIDGGHIVAGKRPEEG